MYVGIEHISGQDVSKKFWHIDVLVMFSQTLLIKYKVCSVRLGSIVIWDIKDPKENKGS